MRLFARFQTVPEHERFISGLLQAKEIRQRIKKLQVRLLGRSCRTGKDGWREGRMEGRKDGARL